MTAERRRTRLFLRKDDYGRFMSCLVYLPRDRYNTAVRLRIEAILSRAFNAAGWDFEPGDVREIGDLPACTFQRDGETVLQPCAETLLGERAGQALLEAGLMPLMSHKHRNAVTVMRLQSVALPARPLAGLPQRR